MKGIREELRVKLDSFIRKYYQNRLLKGLMYFTGLGISCFLLVIFLEYIGQFGKEVRLGLFWIWILGTAFILFRYIVVPLLGLARLGKHLSYREAARIIGNFFPEVRDRVTNTLELSDNEDDNVLIKASIDQRIAALKPVPFGKAIDFKENIKYWPVLVIPVLIFLILLFSGQWSIMKESGRRIVEYNKEFVPEMPFRFVLVNEDLKVEQGEDFMIRLRFSGSSLPESARLLMNDGAARFVRSEPNLFEYNIENIQENTSFRLEANGFQSQVYEIDVIPVPVLRSLTIVITPPAYTGIKTFTGEGRSVIDVPEGADVEWVLKGNNIDFAGLVLEDTTAYMKKDKGDFFFSKRVKNGFSYKLLTGNKQTKKQSDAENMINVIKDQYPGIDVDFMEDSNATNVLFFKGNISDDYGLKSLEYEIVRNNEVLKREGIRINKGSIGERVSGVVDLDSLRDIEGEIELRLRVWDNDAVNGSKSSNSVGYKINILSEAEQKEQINSQYESYFSQKEKLGKMNEALLEDIKALRNKLMNDRKADWRDKEHLKELMKKQDELLKKEAELDRMKEDVKKKEEKLSDKSEEIKEKEEKIEELEKDSKQEELEELMKEIDKLMEKLDVEKLKESLKKMEEMSSENKRKNERIDDLLKDLKFQKDVLEQSEKMKELSEKMDELSKKEDAGESEEQKDVKEEFEKIKEELEKLKEENEAFEKETEKEELEKKSEEIDESMKKASEQLQKSQDSKANDQQKKSSEQMSEMSDKMTSSMMQMQAEQHMENMQTLRQILENLEILSTDVEDLSELSKKSGKSDPLYRKLLVDQRRLQDGAKIIRDSLVALSERVPEVKEDVFKELRDIDNNLEKSIENLQEQNGVQSAAFQQHVMTASNNLALLLDQALRNMQQQMASMKKGDQTCQKPGGGKPSLENMRKMQGELGDMMKEMQGKKEGEGKKSQKRGGKEIVEMLSRQEQVRQTLEDYMKEEEGKEGKSGSKGDLQKALDEMKDLEKDMLDGDISLESLDRIKEIESRLLESEKAELEQEEDEKRESKTSDNISQLYKEELDKYLKEKEFENEELYMTPLKMKKYYKNRSNIYLTKP